MDSPVSSTLKYRISTLSVRPTATMASSLWRPGTAALLATRTRAPPRVSGPNFKLRASAAQSVSKLVFVGQSWGAHSFVTWRPQGPEVRRSMLSAVKCNNKIAGIPSKNGKWYAPVSAALRVQERLPLHIMEFPTWTIEVCKAI